MFRPVSICILALSFLLSATELHELFRVPFLVSHYQQHRRVNASMNIWDFLALHYSNEHPYDQDEQEDQGLPFKSSANINHLGPTWLQSPSTLGSPYPISIQQFIIPIQTAIPAEKLMVFFILPACCKSNSVTAPAAPMTNCSSNYLL
jgi:hypothetical protein